METITPVFGSAEKSKTPNNNTQVKFVDVKTALLSAYVKENAKNALQSYVRVENKMILTVNYSSMNDEFFDKLIAQNKIPLTAE